MICKMSFQWKKIECISQTKQFFIGKVKFSFKSDVIKDMDVL